MPDVEFTVTLTYKYRKSYEDLERFYGTQDLFEAAGIDEKNFRDEPEFISEDLNYYNRAFDLTVTAEEVSE